MKQATFAKLQAQWDKKLKDSGFKDLEYRNRPYGPMREPLGDIRRHLTADTIRGVDADGCSYSFSPTALYYERRGDFLREHKFRTKGDRFVFERAADGRVPAEIFKEMRKNGRFKAWTYWRVRYSLEVSNKAFAKWAAQSEESEDDE